MFHTEKIAQPIIYNREMKGMHDQESSELIRQATP
jgi:hypothetical protein